MVQYFIDRCVIKISGGNGGNGCASFVKSTKGIVGVNGGNGGNGGNIVFYASSSVGDLSDCASKYVYKGHKGHHGSSALKHGAKGKDLYIPVPLGTIIKQYDTQEIIYDFVKINSTYTFKIGGKGGLGNTSLTNRKTGYASTALKGDVGITYKLILELKLLANGALVGSPNVGKSSILNKLSNATVLIGDYPFTTLSPNLGVINKLDNRYILADIPGLVKDAYKGKGIGIQFLKHISRCEEIFFVIAINECDLIGNLKMLYNELSQYDINITKKRFSVILSKYDLCVDRLFYYRYIFKKLGYRVFCVSSYEGTGFDSILYYLRYNHN